MRFASVARFQQVGEAIGYFMAHCITVRACRMVFPARCFEANLWGSLRDGRVVGVQNLFPNGLFWVAASLLFFSHWIVNILTSGTVKQKKRICCPVNSANNGAMVL